MNGILLITVTVTVALVYGYNSRPCQPRNYDNNHNPYKDFRDKHILQQDFDRSSATAWESYLYKKGLCNRTPQTFMEMRDLMNVLNICNGHGRHLCPHHSNLCISDKLIMVYQVDIDRGCKVERLEKYPNYVIVACDKIGQYCLPVHHEQYYGEYPDPNAPICRL